MNMITEKQGDVLIIQLLENKFTNMYANEFRDKCIAWIQEGNYKLLLNLEKVNYIDSSAIGSIISAINFLNDTIKIHTTTGQFAVCCVNQNVDSLISMLKLNDIISVYSTQESALSEM